MPVMSALTLGLAINSGEFPDLDPASHFDDLIEIHHQHIIRHNFDPAQIVTDLHLDPELEDTLDELDFHPELYL